MTDLIFKITINDYFNQKINRLDIDIESMILNLESKRDSNLGLRKEIQNEIDCLNQIRNQMIDEIKQCQEYNQEKFMQNRYSDEITQLVDYIHSVVDLNGISLDDFYESFPLPQKILKSIIKTDCFYIEKKYLKISQAFKTGILININYFMDLYLKVFLRSCLGEPEYYFLSSERKSPNNGLFFIDSNLLIAILFQRQIKQINGEHTLRLDREFLFENIKLIKICDWGFTSISSSAFNPFRKLECLNFHCRVGKIFDLNTKLENLKYLCLEGCDLESLQEKMFTSMVNLLVLTMDDNRIMKISKNSFDGLKNLKRLSLINCHISELENGCFRDCKQLLHLDLESNNISSINAENFRGLENLEKLIIDLNEIEKIHLKSFIHLNNLKILSINKSMFYELQPKTFMGLSILEELFNSYSNLRLFANSIGENAFHGCKKLKKLRIVTNRLIIHPNGFNELDFLESFDAPYSSIKNFNFKNVPNLKLLKCERLEDIDYELIKSMGDTKLENLDLKLPLTDWQYFGLINSVSSLKELRIHKLKSKSNDLMAKNYHRIKPNIRNIRSLKFESCSQRQIKMFNIESMINLDSFSMIKCGIKSIDRKILDCIILLKELSMENNSIESLDDFCFAKLVNLEKLNLSRNKIKVLKNDQFYGLKSLRCLCVNNNLISNITTGIFSECLSNLDILEMNNNRITSIDKNSFFNLTGLSKLELYGNQISDIDCGAFSNLNKLEMLNLASNSIAELATGTLDSLISLIEVNLSKNSINFIEKDLFKNQTKLTILQLNNNKLNNSEFEFLEYLPKLKELEIGKNELSELDFQYFDYTKEIEKIDSNKNKLKVLRNFKNSRFYNENADLDLSNGFIIYPKYTYDDFVIC